MGNLEHLISTNGTLWERILKTGAEKEDHCLCKRKAVVATLYHLATQRPIFQVVNGPVAQDATRDDCSGEIGNCGCVHAELIAAMWLSAHETVEGMILCTTYSPCQACANAIIISDRIIACVYDKKTENYTDGCHILERNNILIYALEDCEFHGDDHLRN